MTTPPRIWTDRTGVRHVDDAKTMDAAQVARLFAIATAPRTANRATDRSERAA